MSPRYDVLVIDLDGTLLRCDGTVSDANRRAVARARAAGLHVVIATGRALVESRAALDAVEHDGPIVAAGGAILHDAATGATLDRRAMPHDLVAEVARTLVDDGHKALILKDATATGYDYLAVGPAALDPASEWWFEKLAVRVQFVHDIADDPHPHDTVRAAAVAGSSELAPLAQDLHERVGERAFLQHWAAVTESDNGTGTTHLLEVFDREVNKWTMLCAWCAQCGVDPGRTAAIGDGLNDVQLVAGAALGVAMSNADERVLAAAQRVTASNEEDGVAVAIDRILAGVW